MTEQEKDEAKSQKFQERLARISRRRFVQAAALGGAAALAKRDPANAAENQAVDPRTPMEHADMFELRLWNLVDKNDISERCANTMALLLDFEIGKLFHTPLFSLLDSTGDDAPITKGKARLKKLNNSDVPWNDFMNPLKIKLGNDWQSAQLHLLKDDKGLDLFRTPISNKKEVKKACENASKKFVIPFFNIPDTARGEAADFLDGFIQNKKKPEDEIYGFLKAFEKVTVGQLFFSRMQAFDEWELHLIQMAKRLGILRLYPGTYQKKGQMKAEELPKRKCLYQTGPGAWACRDINDDSYQCGTENGFPLSGSDFCQ